MRGVGLELGLPEEIVYRQPFPGPGLAIRIIGEITHDKLAVLQEADAIVMDEVRRNDLYRELWQSFAVLTDTRSVGVTGDFRTYGHVIAIRAVSSEDAMTADWARIPYDVLGTHFHTHRQRKQCRASTAWCTTSPASPRAQSNGSKPARAFAR